MSVEFEEPEFEQPPKHKEKKTKLVGLLMKTGFVKSKVQANLIMVGIILLMTLIFFVSINSLK